MEDDELITTHFTRSKTDTRFPTGLSTELPSGVKRTFPCLYTVPQRFENWWMKVRRRAEWNMKDIPGNLPS